MEAMLAPVDEPLIAALGLDAPLRIVDVGCGGGATAAEVFRRAPAGSEVHGFDISPRLVELARERIRPGDVSLRFEVADMAVTAPHAPYERMLSRFGVMFFSDPASAFANLARWLAPEGRFAFAVWRSVAENPWFAVVRDVVARTVDLTPTVHDTPGPFRYADASALTKLLEKAGLTALDVRAARPTLPIGGGLPADAAARFALSSFSSFGEALARVGGDAVDQARAELENVFARHEHGGVVELDAAVHVVTGARPR